jgi:hypothetical protein
MIRGLWQSVCMHQQHDANDARVKATRQRGVVPCRRYGYSRREAVAYIYATPLFAEQPNSGRDLLSMGRSCQLGARCVALASVACHLGPVLRSHLT